METDGNHFYFLIFLYLIFILNLCQENERDQTLDEKIIFTTNMKKTEEKYLID